MSAGNDDDLEENNGSSPSSLQGMLVAYCYHGGHLNIVARRKIQLACMHLNTEGAVA